MYIYNELCTENILVHHLWNTSWLLSGQRDGILMHASLNIATNASPYSLRSSLQHELTQQLRLDKD